MNWAFLLGFLVLWQQFVTRFYRIVITQACFLCASLFTAISLRLAPGWFSILLVTTISHAHATLSFLYGGYSSFAFRLHLFFSHRPDPLPLESLFYCTTDIQNIYNTKGLSRNDIENTAHSQEPCNKGLNWWFIVSSVDYYTAWLQKLPGTTPLVKFIAMLY